MPSPRPHPDSQQRALRLDAGALDAADVAAWSELADRAVEPNPFFRPEFVLASVAKRRAPVELLVVRDDDRWLACMPFRRTGSWRRIPLPCLHPWLPEYSYLATLLIDRDAVRAAAEAFVAEARAQRDAAMFVFDMCDPEGPVADALVAAARRLGVPLIVQREFERAAWRRLPDGSEREDSMNEHKRQRLLAKQSRQLARHLDTELEVLDRAGDPAAWETFLAMENSGWKGEQGTALAAKPTDAAFFRAMCAGMSGRGGLELRSLEGGGRSVAMECCLKEGDELIYGFKIAYDAEFSKFSPGAQLQALTLQRFDDVRPLLYDSCAWSENAVHNRIWPDRRRMQVLVLPTVAPVARLLPFWLWIEATARGARDGIRRRRRAATAATLLAATDESLSWVPNAPV